MRVRDSEDREETMNDTDFRFGLFALALLLAMAFVAGVILAATPADSSAQVPTWTPRPTGLPTHEVFLPLVEREGPPTATPIPRPTIGVSNDED